MQVLKVDGHATKDDVAKGKASARQAFLNDCAYIQTGTASGRAQLPPNVAPAVQDLAARATKVHKRLAEVAQVFCWEKRKEFVKPPPAVRLTRPVPRWERVFLTRAEASEHQVFRHRLTGQVLYLLQGGQGKVGE